MTFGFIDGCTIAAVRLHWSGVAEWARNMKLFGNG